MMELRAKARHDQIACECIDTTGLRLSDLTETACSRKRQFGSFAHGRSSFFGTRASSAGGGPGGVGGAAQEDEAHLVGRLLAEGHAAAAG